MVGILVCSCGLSREIDAWMPTSGAVGEKREAGVSCIACDEEAVGLVEIVEVR
jgi:hypothetical protein